MKDLETIAQLLLSPDPSSKEIGLFLIKSQGVDIYTLYDHIKTGVFGVIDKHIKNITPPNEELYEVDHFNLVILKARIYIRIQTYSRAFFALNDDVFSEVWEDDIRHKAGYILGDLPTITIDEVAEKFTQLVIEELKAL